MKDRLLVCPFYYFWSTRLKTGSLLFHFTFEWLSAGLLACRFGKNNWLTNLAEAVGCYLAFICIYEIGYICNDYFSARKETHPRRRGAGDRSVWQIWAMILCRLIWFTSISWVLAQHQNPCWIAFYAALSLTFALHNLPLPVELKVITFSWLSVYRFTAPTIFVIKPEFLPSLLLTALLFYTGYRIWPYLDSKGVLNLPGRQSRNFRLAYFASILPLARFLQPYGGGELVFLMSIYFFALALAGYVVNPGSPRTLA